MPIIMTLHQPEDGNSKNSHVQTEYELQKSKFGSGDPILS
jgi:hypothetical protein